jgi:hypothetical protein
MTMNWFTDPINARLSIRDPHGAAWAVVSSSSAAFVLRYAEANFMSELLFSAAPKIAFFGPPFSEIEKS